MDRDFVYDYDNYDLDDYFYGMYKDRLITTEEIDAELDRIIRKENGLLGLRRMKGNLSEKMNQFATKVALYVVKDIMLKEMQKSYYSNVGNILKIIDINSHTVPNHDGSYYNHIENLCIWQNGFYEFNSFSFSTLASRMARKNNFSEEIAQELEKFGFRGKLVPIEKQDKGTNDDYAKLEAKILKMSKQHESYTE